MAQTIHPGPLSHLTQPPALKYCANTNSGSEKAFKVYIRTYKRTAKEERARLQAFMEQHPHFAASIRAKPDSLEKHSDDTTVWRRY
jgi:hypothetical protein